MITVLPHNDGQVIVTIFQPHSRVQSVIFVKDLFIDLLEYIISSSCSTSGSQYDKSGVYELVLTARRDISRSTPEDPIYDVRVGLFNMDLESKAYDVTVTVTREYLKALLLDKDW